MCGPRSYIHDWIRAAILEVLFYGVEDEDTEVEWGEVQGWYEVVGAEFAQLSCIDC